MSSQKESVELVISPRVKDLGDNFVVRRTLPDVRKRMVGPFIFWDHMGPTQITPQKGMKVRSHPHIGLATITWLFHGEILHRDSLGNEQFIQPGEVNWMTAGSGIAHSERSEPKDKSYTLEGIQLWLALPKEHEKVAPSFFHCKENEIPLIEQNGIQLRLVAGEAFHQRSPVPVYSDLFYLNATGPKSTTFQMAVKDHQEAAIYIVEGSIEHQNKAYHQYDMIILKQGHDIDIKLLESSRFMIIGGEVFPEKRFIWWNFVSTSKEEIELAKTRWVNNQFPQVINEDSQEFIPLPID